MKSMEDFRSEAKYYANQFSQINRMRAALQLVESVLNTENKDPRQILTVFKRETIANEKISKAARILQDALGER